jgi:hypothetical protein
MRDVSQTRGTTLHWLGSKLKRPFRGKGGSPAAALIGWPKRQTTRLQRGEAGWPPGDGQPPELCNVIGYKINGDQSGSRGHPD